MAKKAVDKEVRKAIKDAQRLIEDVSRLDGNEAETRRRLERIFENVMGYDTLKHLSRERAVKASGTSEHVDFAIHLDGKEDPKLAVIIEVKRVGVDLSRKHLRQVASYAIDAGCEWVLLTNGRDWRVYHIEFGQPPETKLLEQWNLLNDDISVLADRFEILSYKNVKKGGLEKLWEKMKLLEPKSVLSAIVSETSLKTLRKTLRKGTGHLIDYEDIIGSIRKLLNEAAAIEMDSLRISIPSHKPRTPKKAALPEIPVATTAEQLTLEREDSSGGEIMR